MQNNMDKLVVQTILISLTVYQESNSNTLKNSLTMSKSLFTSIAKTARASSI